VPGGASAENLGQRSAESGSLLHEAAMCGLHPEHLDARHYVVPPAGSIRGDDIVAGTTALEVGDIDTGQRGAGLLQVADLRQLAIIADSNHPSQLLQPQLAAVTTELLLGSPLDVGAPGDTRHRLAGDLARRLSVRDLDVVVLRQHFDVRQRAEQMPER